jgi:hypothetical protein
MAKAIELKAHIHCEFHLSEARDVWREWNEDQDREDRVKWGEVKDQLTGESLAEWVTGGPCIDNDGDYINVDVEEFVQHLCEQVQMYC